MELLSDFLDYLRSIQRSEGTINGYENDIQIAWVWNLQYNNNIPYIQWTKRHIIKYQKWLLNVNHNSPARIKRLKAALSSLSNYIECLLDDEYPDFRNIVGKVESPINQPVREKTVLTEEQVNYLLNTLTEQGKYKKACVVALAVYSGRRKAELLRFKLDDFTDDRLTCGGSLYKTHKIKTKGRGTQGKMLECYCLAKQFKPYLDRWIEQRNKEGIESEWLFPSPDDPTKALAISTLNTWTKQFTKILGIDFYFHCCRHFTVSQFKRAGIPDTVIQQYIGWTDISMVPVYSDVDADEQLGIYFTENGISVPNQKSFNEI